MTRYLDCGTSPLQKGITLVEASAGTGKTYAIAMLVLRAVCEKAVPIDAILVVTFTRAATEELKSRIRQRLVEAKEALLTGQSVNNDDTMGAWLAGVEDRELYVQRLNLALLDIDRAGIFTIHSFCQRMLQEQALECGQLFDVDLQADIRTVVGQIAADFWRDRVYPMDSFVCGAVTAEYSRPEELLGSIKGAGADYDGLEPENGRLEELAVTFSECYQHLCSWYGAHGDGCRDAFLHAMEENNFKGELRDEERILAVWEAIDLYLSGATFTPAGQLSFLTVSGVLPEVSARVAKKEDERTALFDLLRLPDEDASAFLLAKRNVLIAFRRELLEYLRLELDIRLGEQGIMSYDDLIRRLDVALRNDAGPLRRLLAGRFQAAFIDEFQDTDKAQWAIFEAVFGGGEHFLYLIGDPKQAIYKFRGADIHSYFAAKSAASHLLTLEHNHRSHPDLVESVNQLFTSRSDSFVYGADRLPFNPVKPARVRADGELVRNGEPLGVMSCWQLAKPLKRKKWYPGQAGQRLVKETVGEIIRLLDRTEPVIYCRTDKGEDRSRQLEPGDIAILVRSHWQAEEYLQMCAEVGLPAVVSSRKSVYQSSEGHELHRLLASLAEPTNHRLLRSAMTVSWFGMNGDELNRIWEDDSLLDEWMGSFLIYHRMWRESGFLVMMRSLLDDRQILVKLSGKHLGERRIANILHLIELVQELEVEEKLGPARTLLRLESLIAEESGGEEAELRLESDEQAVQIITMHGSKGLQYPVVFCPYLWHRSSRLEGEQGLVKCHEGGSVTVDLGSDLFEERRQRALEEELAEELRLLYVAVTRAQVRCYIMLANCQKTGGTADTCRSSLAYLLWGGESVEQEEQEVRFRGFAEAAGAEYTLVPEEGELTTEYVKGAAQSTAEPAARRATGRKLETDYMMSSYSAMAALSEHEDHGSDVVREPGEEGSAVIRHSGLPAGPNFGNLVHDCLEAIPFPLVGEPEYEDRITRTSRRYGVEVEPEAIRRLLDDVVRTPLVAGALGSFSLSMLDDAKCIKEMPFYFQIDRLNTVAINRVLADDPAVLPLTAKSMKGYLTGFVDLVCEFKGKYYIIDYKTNYLGENYTDYRGKQLLRAMASHNYGLQYWIYSLVLHRYLQTVLDGYDYSSQFGGVMYLFVRGMDPSHPGDGVFYCRPDEEKLTSLGRLLEGHDES